MKSFPRDPLPNYSLACTPNFDARCQVSREFFNLVRMQQNTRSQSSVNVCLFVGLCPAETVD